MSETSPKTQVAARPPPAAERGDEQALLSLVDRVWPVRAPQREIAGLPPSVAELIRPGRRAAAFTRAVGELDRALPGWTEMAAELVARRSPEDLGEAFGRVCALLARRPVHRPQPLLRALEGASGEKRFWLLVALASTDTPGVRCGWLRCLRGDGDREAAPARALWFGFLRAFVGGWLGWSEFRDCLVSGRALAAAGDDYRPALLRLGLTTHRSFVKWYRQLVYEIAHQPDVSLSFQAGGWIRDFPGEDYLWDALRELERKPDSWWPLHVLRWTSGINCEGADLVARLEQFTPLTLCLLSLLRGDLCPLVGRALHASAHEQVVDWLRASGPNAPLDLTWAERVLRPWAETAGEAATLAAGALCSLEPPPDFEGPADRVLRSRSFLRSHLLSDFDRVMDNLLYVHALRKTHFGLICQQARRGRATAIRALALWPEQGEQAAPIMFRLAREGSKPIREAAAQALQALRERAGILDLGQFEKRLDLASAWSDAGLEGRRVRFWWDVGGYHVRLSVIAGKVTVDAYSGPRHLASLPASVRADPQYPEIRQARADLARSYRYFRQRLEQAMVEGVSYSGRDFAVLLANPVVRSLLSRLVLLVEGTPYGRLVEAEPEEPRCPEVLAGAESIAIAHPLCLLEAGALDEWQERVLRERIGQPFKQLFREIYLLGPEERGGASSMRFAGHLLVARRAFAVLRTRGYAPGGGEAVKEWPTLGLHACISWAQPEEEAGRRLAEAGPTAPVTSGPVRFRGEDGDWLPLDRVPPVALSETLRDADLLVSRAAAGEPGFTSEETRRLRATLVRYLARALGLTSVYVSDDQPYVLVEGQRAMYRVHLGSGSVLLEKSRRSLDLGPVRSLPMATLAAESMDSLTARIMGIIATLSHDERITDARFLAQLSPTGVL